MYKFRQRIAGDAMETEKWILCPVCTNKLRIRIRGDTVGEKMFVLPIAFENEFLIACNRH